MPGKVSLTRCDPLATQLSSPGEGRLSGWSPGAISVIDFLSGNCLLLKVIASLKHESGPLSRPTTLPLWALKAWPLRQGKQYQEGKGHVDLTHPASPF